MSRMTASIKRINEHLEKVSGMAGKSSEIMESVVEPLVEFVCNTIYSGSVPCFDDGDWTAEWVIDEFGYKCSKCGEYLPSGDDDITPQFCPSCGRATTPDALKELERRLMGYSND